MKNCIYIGGGVVFASLIGFYLVHIWSDCLQQHSILTCMRMLGR